MPQTTSAKKALRASARRKATNIHWRRKVRNALRSAREAIHTGQKQPALDAAMKAESILDRAARRNIIHPNKAARKKSRLQQAIAKTGK